jgi:hypothetical protein
VVCEFGSEIGRDEQSLPAEGLEPLLRNCKSYRAIDCLDCDQEPESLSVASDLNRGVGVRTMSLRGLPGQNLGVQACGAFQRHQRIVQEPVLPFGQTGCTFHGCSLLTFNSPDGSRYANTDGLGAESGLARGLEMYT